MPDCRWCGLPLDERDAADKLELDPSPDFGPALRHAGKLDHHRSPELCLVMLLSHYLIRRQSPRLPNA